MNEQLTPLPDLSAKLRTLTGYPGPGYRRIHVLALDGAFPSIMLKGRRYVADADLPAVAAALGLTIPTDRVV